MGFFVVVVRAPFGIAASAVLLLWSLLVVIIYMLIFVFLSLFGKLKQINENLNPWLESFNGVKFFPGVWGWVFRPYQGIFEENPAKSVEIDASFTNQSNQANQISQGSQGSRLSQLRSFNAERNRDNNDEQFPDQQGKY